MKLGIKKTLQAVMLSLAILFGAIGVPTAASAQYSNGYWCEWLPSWDMECGWHVAMFYGTWCAPVNTWEYVCVPCYGHCEPELSI